MASSEGVTGEAMAQENLSKLEEVLAQFEITIAQANDLVVLQDYEIIVIADDSGSMKNIAAPIKERKKKGVNPTRWDELKSTIGAIVEIATCFIETGIDIHFLNRDPLMGVKSINDASLSDCFAAPPEGATPLTEKLEMVVKKYTAERDRKLLIFILTDGEPNDGRESFCKKMRGFLDADSAHRIRVQIMACTCNETEIEWLNRLDSEFQEVDVTDDYYAEKVEVLKKGKAEKFTRGDWCMKAMLGPVSHKFDIWDESLKKKQVPQCDPCSVM